MVESHPHDITITKEAPNYAAATGVSALGFGPQGRSRVSSSARIVAGQVGETLQFVRVRDES